MFKVPIDYQCAILVFHAASHPQCEQLPRNARQIARVARRGPARGEGRADARLPIGNRTKKGSSEILLYDAHPRLRLIYALARPPQIPSELAAPRRCSKPGVRGNSRPMEARATQTRPGKTNRREAGRSTRLGRRPLTTPHLVRIISFCSGEQVTCCRLRQDATAGRRQPVPSNLASDCLLRKVFDHGQGIDVGRRARGGSG